MSRARAWAAFLILSAGCHDPAERSDDPDVLAAPELPQQQKPKEQPPILAPAGDDWRQFGHDAQRTNLSKESIGLPYLLAWTYTIEAPARRVANAVAAAGYVHIHSLAEGNGLGANSGFKNPWLVTLNGLTGELRGTFTPQKDLSGGHWLAVFDDFNVVYHDDSLGAYDCRNFNDKRWVGLDRWGPLAVDDTLKLVFHANNLMADGDPPLIEATSFKGVSLWKQNVWAVKKEQGRSPILEVNVAGGLCIAAARYVGSGPPPPKDGLYAFDPAKGEKKWFLEGKFRNLASGKRLYALEDAGMIHALDFKDGKEAWQSPLGNTSGSPGLFKDRLIALLTTGELVAMSVEDGKVLWNTKVEGAVGAGYDRTSMLLAAPGRALVCTKEGLSIFELEKGECVGVWKMDDSMKALFPQGPTNPVVARGHIYFCGEKSVAALWTSDFLRDQPLYIVTQAESIRKAGRVTEAIRILLAVEGTEGVKEASKKKVQEALTAINRAGEKEFEQVAPAKAKGHLFRAKGICDDLAKKYSGIEIGKKAAAEGDALGKKLEDPAVASEAAYREADSMRELGNRKEAARAFKAITEKWPDTEWGQKATDQYKKLKEYDR